MKEDLAPLTTLARAVGVILLLWAIRMDSHAGCLVVRWIVLAVSLYCGISAYRAERHAWALIFGLVALVLSPLMPVGFWQAAWVPMCAVGTVVFIVSLLVDPVF